MTKYYKCSVEVRQIIEVDVAAETESDARRRAKEAALKRIPGADIWTIELKLEGETRFQVGSRIQHELFGAGEIKALARSSSSQRGLTFRATVQFDEAGLKEMTLPHEKIRPESSGT